MNIRDAGYPIGHFARRLIIDDDALIDDRPRLRWNSFVIPAARRTASGFGPVTDDVHKGRPVPKIFRAFSGGAMKLVPA